MRTLGVAEPLVCLLAFAAFALAADEGKSMLKDVPDFDVQGIA